MNNVKSWKKNLKKTGALALATLVMCGSAYFVHAEEAITLNGGGNEHSVYGYQTDESNGYAANITWGDMIFVYDNGTYDPETGRLIATDTLSGVQPDALRTTVTTETPEYGDHGGWLYENATTQAVYESKMIFKKLNEDSEVTEEIYDSWTDEGLMRTTDETVTVGETQYTVYNICELSETGEETLLYKVVYVGEVYVNVEDHSDTLSEPTDLQVLYATEKKATDAGYWYNFNGHNNSVEVQNLSTYDLQFTATPKVITENAGEDVSFSLYSREETEGLTYNADYQPTHDIEEDTWYVGTSLTKTLVAPELDPVTGEITAMHGQYGFYLNISGKPSNAVISESKYNGTDATEIGTITLSFQTHSDQSGFTPSGLNPIMPDNGE